MTERHAGGTRPDDGRPTVATLGPTSEARRDARDLNLVRRLGELYVGVVSDCLDRAGYRDGVMAPHIRPLDPESSVAGFAATFQLAASEVAPNDPAAHYSGEIAAVESIQAGDVIVASTLNRSFWGELLATATRQLGGVGIVADAYTRDTRALVGMGFPTFISGIGAQDALGRVEVAQHGVPITCGGVRVGPGDLVLADRDGVVVVPIEVADEVLSAAEEKVGTENSLRSALRSGVPLSDAFAAHGVL